MHRDIQLNHWHDDHNRIESWNQCDSHPYHIFVVFVNNTKIPYNYNLITFLQLVGYWFYLPYFIIILTLCLIEIYVCVYIYIYIYIYIFFLSHWVFSFESHLHFSYTKVCYAKQSISYYNYYLLLKWLILGTSCQDPQNRVAKSHYILHITICENTAPKIL